MQKLDFLFRPVSSEAADRRLGQRLLFVSSPVVLILALRAVSTTASGSADLVLGILVSLILALLVVLLGFVLPLSTPPPWHS